MNSVVSIRFLSETNEFRQLEPIQRQAWGRDDRAVVPWEFMKIARFNGAIVLGAFDGDKLVGYVFGIIGAMPVIPDGPKIELRDRIGMYSHHLGVLPSYQGHGIGRRLKLAQRQYCKEQGIELIAWTFDPLMARNAWLNLGRLGGINQTFLPDWYGEERDRFFLQWWIDSERVETRLHGVHQPKTLDDLLAEGAEFANPTRFDDDGYLHPSTSFRISESGRSLVEIPYNMPEIREKRPELAADWSTHAKKVFPNFLTEGFMVTDFVRHQTDRGRRAFYLFTHPDVVGPSLI